MKLTITTSLSLFFAFHVQAQQIIYDSIVVDGLTRQYAVYVPPSYSPNTAAPVVLNFHGYTSNAIEQMFYGDFRALADTAGFLVVHPQGTIDLLGNTHWNVGWGSSSVDDVAFTEALLDKLATDYNINEDRIYSTGMSNGGFFSYYLACNLSERIAAVASVTGSMGSGLVSTCDPSHKMPVMEIHGTADPTVPYNGNFLAVGIPDVLQFWSFFNATDQPPFVYEVNDIVESDSSSVEHYLYSHDEYGTIVEHFKIINGGHTWPGAIVDIGITNHDINASAEIWRFFSNYDIHGLIETVPVQEPAAQEMVAYPNPTGRYITLEQGLPGTTSYQVHTVSGMLLMEGNTTGTATTIDLGMLPSGMYFLSAGHARLKIYKD